MEDLVSIAVGNEQIAIIKINKKQYDLLQWLQDHGVLKENASFDEVSIESFC